MTHVVTSSHHITLKSGRQVHPGQEVSDKEAAENPQLVERGDLTPRPEEQEAPPAPPAPDPAPSPPAPPEAKTAPSPAEQGAEKTTPTPKRRGSKAPAAGSVPNKEDQK